MGVSGLASPSAVWDVYARSCESLSIAYAQVRVNPQLLILPIGQSLSVASPTSTDNIGQTPRETADWFREMRNELDHWTTLALVASAEALFQVDCRDRATRKSKDIDWKPFRRLTKRAELGKQKLRLEDILDHWAQVLCKQELIGRMKQVIRHRHWLAHGRYWSCKCGNHWVEPADAWDLIHELHSEVAKVAAFPSL